jgi:ABC-type ATPase involved in cell division
LIKLVAGLRDAGSAVVLATHDVALQEALADRVVQVCEGRVSELVAART